jgi:hypothetical protein
MGYFAPFRYDMCDNHPDEVAGPEKKRSNGSGASPV